MPASPEAPAWPVSNIDFDAANAAAKKGELEKFVDDLAKPAAPAEQPAEAAPASAEK